jgi:hypothetical protein
MDKPRYVMCFAFDQGCHNLVTASKQSKSTGVPSGIIKEGHTAQRAAARALWIEANVYITPKEWVRFATLRRKDSTISCMYAADDRTILAETVAADVQVSVHRVEELCHPANPSFIADNVGWLALMAKEHYQGGLMVFNMEAVFDV